MKPAEEPEDVMVDAEDAPMKGTFPTVSVADENDLRAAGYVPVLRWVVVLQSGGLSKRTVTTSAALKAVRVTQRTAKRQRKARRR